MKCLVLATTLVASSIGPAALAYRHRPSAPAPIRVELTLGTERMNYGDAIFTAHPHRDGQSLGAVNLTGKSFGATRMSLFDAGLHIEGITHHVVAGAAVGFLYDGFGHGATGVSADPARYGSGPERVSTGSDLTGFYVGPTLGTAWSWKSFDLAVTTTFGYREVAVSLLGFDEDRCGRGGTSRCPPSATYQSFFAQSRVALGIHHGSWGIGGYFGGDVTPSASGWSMGAHFEIADGMFRQRANASATAPSAEAR